MTPPARKARRAIGRVGRNVKRFRQKVERPIERSTFRRIALRESALPAGIHGAFQQTMSDQPRIPG